jgi:hypothetical protein
MTEVDSKRSFDSLAWNDCALLLCLIWNLEQRFLVEYDHQLHILQDLHTRNPKWLSSNSLLSAKLEECIQNYLTEDCVDYADYKALFI